jgi:hypothetical protein
MSHWSLSFPLPICFIMCHHRPSFHPISHAPPTSFLYRLPTLRVPTLRVNVGFEPYTFPNPFDHAHVGPFPPSILPTPLVAHDQTSQPTLFSTRLQLAPKVYCPICWCQFISQRLIHQQRSHQPLNSFNPNPCDHFNSIPSIIPTPLAPTWTSVSSLDVLGSFNLSFCHPWLYNYILVALWRDVQIVFHFPVDKLAHDPMMWQLGIRSFCYPNGVSFCPLVTGQRKMMIRSIF